MLTGRYEESAAHHRAALELDADYPLALVTAGWVHLLCGRDEQAIASTQRAMTVTGGTSFYRAGFDLVCAMMGRRDEAVAVIDNIQQRAASRYVSQGALCWVHAALGNVDEALRCLETAYAQRDSMLVCLTTFFGWDPIRDTDIFRGIVARMKFPRPMR